MAATFLIATAVVSGLITAVGLPLFFAARRPAPENDPLVERIDAILPQTQCGRCDYAGCRPYAEAIAAGDADINQCPPGGQAGVNELARLLGREPPRLNPEHGVQGDPVAARVDEDRCIGCTRCIQACPVDAIVGAPKMMHVVIESECTGCELCLPPCPVDCIDLVPRPGPALWERNIRRPFPVRVDAAQRSLLPGRIHG